MPKHAWLSFSDANRWLNCLGAKNFTGGIPAREPEEFSAEGTAAHSVREACLKFGFTPYDLVGTKVGAEGFVFNVDREMSDHLMPGIDEVNAFDGRLVVEARVDGTEWLGLDPNGERQEGTLDAAVVGSKLIVISDLKYGQGVAVSPVHNAQQKLYALALWKQVARHISEAKSILIVIDQPRNHAGGGYWSTTIEDLLKWGEWVKQRAALTRRADAPLTAGEAQCRWCPAANVPGRHGGCPEHHRWVAKQIDLKFEDLDKPGPWAPPPYKLLTPERKMQIVRAKKGIEQWLEWVHADAIADGLANRPTPAMKVVDGRRPPQKWRDKQVAQAYLEQVLPEDKVFTQKVITPTQAEAELGIKLPVALVERGSPKPVLVSVDDIRPAKKSIDDKFDEMSDEI